MNSKIAIECLSGSFNRVDHKIAYRVYRHSNISTGRRLLLIHGAGVAGRHTWEALQRFLTGWSEILVPDLRGAGETQRFDGEEHPFSVVDLVDDVDALVSELSWDQFDLAGYSLGGLVAMLLKQRLPHQIAKQYLLESAALDRHDWSETLSVRRALTQAADVLHGSDTEAGIRQFLDTISPNRRISPQVERLTIERLAQRAKGFAHALESVTEAIKELDREQLLAAQGDVTSFIGGLSVDPMHQLHRHLAERLPNWHYFLVNGTDHSLPYQKPRQIAAIMDQELIRFISAK